MAGQEDPDPDVIAPLLEGRQLSAGQHITVFNEAYWRNPAVKNRMKAQRFELALMAMGACHAGFDQLIHTAWQDMDTEVGGKLSVRAATVVYAGQPMQIVQEQLYNSYGRLIEERIVLVAPESPDNIGE